MILSDIDIKKAIKDGQITIDPFFPNCVQPASVDLHLDKRFIIFKNTHDLCIDPKESMEHLTENVEVEKNGYFVLHPQEFALGNTIEKIGVSRQMVGRLEGKSSLGRIGVLIHVTAGFLDPGNNTTLTLELYNVSNLPVKLYPGMKIAQMAFESLSSPCETPYGSKKLKSRYYGYTKPHYSLIHKHFELVKIPERK